MPKCNNWVQQGASEASPPACNIYTWDLDKFPYYVWFSIYKSNHTQASENTANGEISHHTISVSEKGFGDIGIEENIAYGQVPCRSTNMSRNEAYGVLSTTGDYEDV
jgi:hypothetical protein